MHDARHDNTGKIQPGCIGASQVQRQWIGLSVQGDHVSIEPFPSPPHPSAPSFLQSIDIEVGFLKPRHEVAEQFSADDMAHHVVKAFNGIIMSTDEIIVFEYHGQNIKGTIKGVSVLDIADEQRRGGANGQRSVNHQFMGIIMDKTDVTIMKAADSLIKIRSSAKK